jgi:DinB family protein
MNSELQGYGDQLLSVRQDAVGLMSGLSDAQFNWQPAPGRWSMAGCFDHLNKSALQLFIPKIDAAIARARREGLESHGPFAYSAFERWAIRNNDAPAKMRFKAPRNVRPAANVSIDQARSEFVRWQDELAKRLLEANGLDLRRAKEAFPFWPLKWSLGSLIQMMIAHERRHVWQAREVRQSPAFPA